MVHFVELSLFPDWVGAEQERLVEVSGTGWSWARGRWCSGESNVPPT